MENESEWECSSGLERMVPAAPTRICHLHETWWIKRREVDPCLKTVFETELVADVRSCDGLELVYLRYDKDIVPEWKRLTGALYQA